MEDTKTEQTKVIIELPQAVYTTKIAGEEFAFDVRKMHTSWLDKLMVKACQRLVNDTFSSAGDAKLKLSREMQAAMMSGEPAPERIVISRAAENPVEALARKNAKADLLAVFKARTDKGKIADMIEADKIVAAYFTIEGVWIDDKVLAFMAKNIAKRDYMAEAEATLAIEL